MNCHRKWANYARALSKVTVSPRRKTHFRFREEPVPAHAPPGSKAYRGDFETFVITGLVTGISGRSDSGFVFDSGSDVKVRKSRPGSPDNVSHIIVPAGCHLPAEFIEK